MATEFSREFFADNRIVKASLRCAHKLREKDLDRIKSEIKKLYDATEVILNITVDESLLSGYVLQVGDRVFDNSGSAISFTDCPRATSIHISSSSLSTSGID